MSAIKAETPAKDDEHASSLTPPSLLRFAEGVAQTGVASGGFKTIR